MILFYTIVWGESHINKFLNYTLPVIMPFIKSLGEYRYIVETTPEDEKYLKSKLPFEIISTDFKRLNTYVEKHIHEKFNDMHRTAYQEGYHLQLIAPDVFHFNLDKAWERMNELGKRCCVLPVGAIRVNDDDFLSEYKHGMAVEDVHKLVRKHLHGETKEHFIDTNNWFTHPAMMIFPDFTIHSFIHRGWFIKPDRNATARHSEWDAVNNFIQDKESLYYIPDISEGYEFSPSPVSRGSSPEEKFNPVKMAEKLYYKTNAVMRESFRRGYRAEKGNGYDKTIVDKVLHNLIS